MGRKTRYYDVMKKERFVEILNEYPLNGLPTAIQSLARDIGCNKTTFNLYLNEYGRELSPEIVIKIAKKTGVSLDWLYGFSNKKYREKFVRTNTVTMCEDCPLRDFEVETEENMKTDKKYRK